MSLLPHRWRALHESFFAQWSARDFPAALATANDLLALAKDAYGPRHPAVVQSLLDLSMAQQASGNPEGPVTEQVALALLEELRAEAATHPDAPQTADLFLFEADRLWNLTGDKPAVLEKYQRAVQVRERAFGPQHPETAQALARLGEVEDLRANFTAAEALYRRAVDGFDHGGETGEPYRGKALAGLGRTLLHLGRPVEAWPFFERALQWAETHDLERRPYYFLLMGATECRRALDDAAGAAAYEARALALLSKANPGADGFHV